MIMKNINKICRRLPRWFVAAALLCGTGSFTTSRLAAAETPKADAEAAAAVQEAPAEVADYKNWIEVGTGGLILNGDEGKFKHQHSMSGDVFGGIEDMHIQQDIGKNGLFVVDGRAIFDTKDYNLKMELSQTDLGYIKAGFSQFRTWYDGNGGYFPGNGAASIKSFNNLFDNELAIDRGEVWVELGLRMPDIPEITLRYSHEYRDGQKDSTIWGPTTRTGLGTTRLIVPAMRDIDETRDIFTADLSKTYGNTDIDLGMRYEYGTSNNRLYEVRNPGEASQILITQREEYKSDLFSGHGSTVTRFNEYVWLTSGYSYTTLDSNIVGGDRIYGRSFNDVFNPTGAAPQNNGFINLTGGGTVDQHVVNLNLMWMPFQCLTITPEVRIENRETNNMVDFTRTTVSPQPGVTRRSVKLLSAYELLNVAESLEVRYTGINDWVFYARAEAEQEDGSRQDRSNNAYNNAGTPLNLDEDQTLLRQKYTVGANWYPLPRLNFAASYYHKVDLYSNDFISDDPVSLDNQRMTNLNFDTDDINVRATWRPLHNLSLVTRYDYQYVSTQARWKEPILNYNYGQASEMTNQVFSESITWNPFARWYLQGTGSYVLGKIHTPASVVVNPRIIQDATNNYYTLSLSSGLALDAKTNLRGDFTYYKAENYEDNSTTGMPYGAEYEEYIASAGFDRQMSEAVRIALKYAYYNSHDITSGGRNDYGGHMIYASTQVKF